MTRAVIGLAVVCLGASHPDVRAAAVEALEPVSDAVRVRVAEPRIEALSDRLMFRLERGRGLPGEAAWEAWLERESTTSPDDPWGNRYFMRKDLDGFTVGSPGPDGVAGTSDDVLVRRIVKRTSRSWEW